MKSALITGILGQDGAYLAQLLSNEGYKVLGLIRRYSNPNFENTDYLGVTKNVEFISGDLTDEGSLFNIIKSTKPDEVYNLAAQSFVGSSWDLSKVTTETNALGVLFLLNALKHFSPDTKFYQASTSEMYGNFKEDFKTEETPMHPRSPYAISKLYSYWLTNNFKESYGMFCCNGILFNHESPIRGKEFVTRKISLGVAKIKLGLDKKIKLGNLESERDWGFAGDYVKAMWLMLQQDTPDNYVIATGETHSIKDFLKEAFSFVGIKNWKPYITVDPKFIRPAELHSLKGNSGRARRKLKWKPTVGFSELVQMMVEADIKRLEHNT